MISLNKRYLNGIEMLKRLYKIKNTPIIKIALVKVKFILNAKSKNIMLKAGKNKIIEVSILIIKYLK